MELKMNYNSFIKLKDFFKLQDVSAEVDEDLEKNDLIEGTLNIKGKYLKRDNITTDYFTEKIPFTILMSSTNYEIEDITCVDIEYVSVEARGIDISFDIFVKYNINNIENDRVDEETNIEMNELENIDFEEIKENETKRIDDLLVSTLNIKNDNHPTEEIIIRSLSDSTSKIKVCYYDSDKELDSICQNNDVSLEQTLNNNKKYLQGKYKRVFINGSKQ